MTYTGTLRRMYYAQRQQSGAQVVIYHPLTSALAKLPTGQTCTYGGSYAADTYKGLDCLRFDSDNTTTANYANIAQQLKAAQRSWQGTFSFWMAKTGFTANASTVFGFKAGYSSYNTNYRVSYRVSKNGASWVAGVCDNTNTYTASNINSTLADGGWHHFCLVCDIVDGWQKRDWSCDIWLDGAYLATRTASVNNNPLDNVGVGLWKTNSTADSGSAYYAALRAYKGKLSQAAIEELASEFTPEE